MSAAAASEAVELRDGGPEDVEGVSAVMAAAFDPRFGEAWTASQLLGMLSLPGVWLTLAIADADCAGFSLARTVVDDAELLLIATHPARRGQGIGTALLSAAVAEAERRGATRIHLEMRSNNPASRLYRSHGFVQTGARRDYYRGRGGERFDAHSYSRIILD